MADAPIKGLSIGILLESAPFLHTLFCVVLRTLSRFYSLPIRLHEIFFLIDQPATRPDPISDQGNPPSDS